MLRRQCRSAARRECGGSAQHEQIQDPIHPTTTSIPTCLSFSATLLHSTPMLPRKTPPARRQGHDTEAAATIRTHPLPHAADKPCYLYTNDAALKGHADYKAAKAGNATAAGRLLRDLAADFIKDTARQFGDSVLFVAPMHAKRAVTTPSRRCSLPRWPSHPAGARTRASCSASASSTPAPTRWNASAFAPTLTATSNPAQTMYSSMTSRPWERRSPNWVTSSKARADRSAAWYCLSTPAAPHGFSRPK